MTERFEQFASLIGGWFWETDHNHRFVYMSNSVEEIIGVPADWHYGKSRMELRSKSIRDDEWQSHVDALNAHEPFENFVFKRASPEGHHWLSTSGTPYFNENGDFAGYRGVARDVTREVELAAQSDRFLAVFDQLNEAIALWDANDHFLYGNQAYKDLNHDVPDATTPGVPYEQYIRNGVAVGSFPEAIGNEEEWIQRRLDLHRNPKGPFEVVRADGRVMTIAEQKLLAGMTALVGTDVTRFKAIESDLLIARDEAFSARSQLMSAIEAIDDGFVYYDAQDRLTIFNDKYQEYYPKSGHLFKIGEKFENLLRAGIEVGEFEGIEGREEEWLQERVSIHQRGNTSIEHHISDGRWLRITERKTNDGGIVGFRIDITELKKAQQAADAAHNQLMSAIEALDDGFVYFDAQDRLAIFNDKYKAYYPKSGPHFEIGMTFEEILRLGLDAGEYTDAIGREDEWLQERLVLHNKANTQVEQKLTDGRWLRIAERRTNDGGIVGFRVDVTALKQAQERAEAASESKSEFLANVSHEIRTPMTGVIGMLDALTETKLNADQMNIIQVAKSSSLALLGILNDVLDQSKIEAGELLIENIDFDLGTLLHEVETSQVSRAREKDLWFTVEISDDVPRALRADSNRLRQVLINLISNAIKFTLEGGITLRVLLGPRNSIKFEVEDTGIGIPEDMQMTIFERFRQQDSSTSRQYGGTGLGLSISKNLVELMKGEMGIRSRKDNGTCFWFTIPLREAKDEVEVGPAMEIQLVEATQPLKILIAEDNNINQLIIERMFDSLGHQIFIVENGAEAVEAVKDFDFDIIFLDIRMPVMDGTTALGEIKALDGNKPRIPCIALTADVTTEHVARYLQHGFEVVVSKPIDRTALARAIDQVTGKNIHIREVAVESSPAA